MNYQEQLLQEEWAMKRLEILERDDFKCVCCQTERPQLRGLVKSFGINTLEEMKEKGYSLFNPKESNGTYENLTFTKDNGINKVSFIGDTERGFDITQLRFAMQCWTAYTAFGKQKGCRLLSFYPETLSGQHLVDLNVHHKFYILGNKAWEYNNDALISLCVDCHKQEHERTEVYVYNQKGDKLYLTEICHRCFGAGHLKEYDYYMNGVCFECWGEGVISIERSSSS